jgi:hypothetical protein
MKHLFIVLPGLILLSLACGGTSLPATPTSPARLDSFELQWEYSTQPFMPLSIAEDALGRPYLYAAQREGGLLILDISIQAQPSKIAVINIEQLGGLQVMYVTQRDKYLYLALGNFFDAKGSQAGMAVVSVEDPEHPVVLSKWISEPIVGGASSVLVDGNYAYLAAMQEGLYIFDISNINEVRFISSIQPDVHFPKPNPSKIEHPNARGMVIRENLLYLAYDAGGLRVIDITDKSHPKEIAKYVNDKITGQQQAYNNFAIHWPYLYAAIDYCGMEILDIEDPQNIQQVAWWNPWSCETSPNTWFSSPGHTNQIAFDANKNLVFLSSGDSELQVVDVSDPTRPFLAMEYGEIKNNLGVWGVTVTDDMIYLAYIKAIIPFQSNWAGIKAVSR